MIPRLTALLLVALIAVALLKPTSPKTGEKWGTRRSAARVDSQTTLD